MDEGVVRLSIREATIADAAAACEVVRSSIVDLCIEDHGNHSATLTAWL